MSEAMPAASRSAAPVSGSDVLVVTRAAHGMPLRSLWDAARWRVVADGGANAVHDALGPGRVPEPAPRDAAIALGMLVAIAVLLESGASTLFGRGGASGRGS